MIKVNKINNKNEFCFNCLKSAERVNLYEIEVDNRGNNSLALRLCNECLIDLGNQINEIFK